MKIAIILISVLLLIFVAVQIFSWKSQKNIETYPYSVIQDFEDFEIRQYESALFTSVQITNDGYSNASSKGFSILGGYIFGANENKETIAMTSPVTMSMEESITMMFMVPSKYDISDLPKPQNGDIKFKKVPARKMAAITFGGWANDEKIESNRQKLISLLDQKNIDYSDNYYFYGYNAPYEFFNRKNEVVIELK